MWYQPLGPFKGRWARRIDTLFLLDIVTLCQIISLIHGQYPLLYAATPGGVDAMTSEITNFACVCKYPDSSSFVYQ